MKKFLTFCLVLACLLTLAGCSASWANEDILNSASIEIRTYNSDGVCTISDKDEIDDICNTFLSLSAKKLNYHKPAVSQYSIRFLNDAGLEIQHIDFLFGNTVVTNGNIYSITDEIHIIEYIQEILSKNSPE